VDPHLQRDGRMVNSAMKSAVCAAVVTCVAIAGLEAGGHLMPRYGVNVSVNKRTDFWRLRTYAWTTGWFSVDPALDAQIAAAVDRELAGIGLTMRDADTSDVLVRYGSLHRNDVDLHARASTAGLRPEYTVGTLVVQVLDRRTQVELFRARADVPLDPGLDKRRTQVDAVVAEMFDKYPTKKALRR